MADYKAIGEALKKGNAPGVKQMVEAAVAEGCSVAEILNEGLVTAMSEIGILFKNNEIYVPEVLIAARAMQAGMTVIKPLLLENKIEPKGRVVIATVKGDLHDIGKNLVSMMMEGAGYEVIDIGIDASSEKFLEAVKDNNADLIAMSALLTTTMPAMKDTVEAITAAGLSDRVKIMIGGAPVTQNFCDEIEADGYAPDAASAVDLADELMATIIK